MEISNFLESMSHPLPDKKHVSKKTGKHSAVLTKPLKDLHAHFIESGAGDVSFAQFTKCRPAHIHTSQKAHLRTCLCKYCANVELNLKVVNAMAARVNNNCRIRHVYHAVDIVTCGRQRAGPDAPSWKKAYALRTCPACGVD